LALGAALVAAIIVAVAALAVRGNGKHVSPLATVLAEAAVATRQGSSPVPARAPATSTNGSPVSAPSTLLIFTGRLSTGWTNGSDAKQASIEIPSSVTHAGHQSVKVSTLAPYAGLSLVSPGTATAGYTHLRFYVRPDKPAALPDVYVSGEIGGHDREGAVFGSAAVTRVAEPDGWTRMDVPLIWVGLDNGSLTRLSWYTNTDQPGISFYLADIDLIKLTPPRLDATQAGSVRFTASFAGKPVPGVVVLVSSGARLVTQAPGQAVFTDIARGSLEYRVTFPDSFEGSPLVNHDDGSLMVKAGTTVDQAITVVKLDLRVDGPKNEAVVTLPVTLSWQAYPGAARYHVEIDPHGPGNSVERDSSQASLTVDATLPPKTLFDYRVTAIDAAGNILARSEPQFFRTP